MLYCKQQHEETLIGTQDGWWMAVILPFYPSKFHQYHTPHDISCLPGFWTPTWRQQVQRLLLRLPTPLAKEQSLSLEAFAQLLCSPGNALADPAKRSLFQDMTQPLGSLSLCHCLSCLSLGNGKTVMIWEDDTSWHNIFYNYAILCWFYSIWQHRSKLSRRPLFAYFVDTSHNTYLEGWIWKSIVFDYVNTPQVWLWISSLFIDFIP